MAKHRRICAQLVLVAFCALPRVALGQYFTEPLQVPTLSDTSDTAVTTDLSQIPDGTPPAAAGCLDCAGRRGPHWRHSEGGLFRHAADNGRDVGLGQPLRGTSWLNRPQYAGWFIGGLRGDDLIKGRVDQNTDLFGGFRFGWDFDHFWGAEARLGFAALNLSDNQVPQRPRTGDVFLADLSVLYYPWGDARWRPYGFVGLGGANFDFIDDVGHRRNDTLLGLPIGLGVKYLTERRWLALRAEIADNIAFADSGLSTMHNVSFTLGVEVHYGLRPKTYWPWHPSSHFW